MGIELFDGILSGGQAVLLIVCLVIALGFEVVNGFHDTANAVATVIYTKSLKPWAAVIWSGICNFLGVFLGGIAVALAVVHLLPVDLLTAQGTQGGLAAVLALLVSALLWNLGTWYLGLPASSSHTLIGAILGVGLANSLLPGHLFGDGVNWTKAGDVGLSLLISPLIGFTLAGLVLWISRKTVRNPVLYQKPHDDQPPPGWVRSLLILTCTGVSFAHGSNDGQKGIGLVMLVLIGILPAQYALNSEAGEAKTHQAIDATVQLDHLLQLSSHNLVDGEAQLYNAADPPERRVAPASSTAAIRSELLTIRRALDGRESIAQIPKEQRWEVRKAILNVDNSLAQLEKHGQLALPAARMAELKQYRGELRDVTDYAPSWVLVAVALSLGIGTMIGWQRIVVTVGEKIGNGHLTYAQGASAELVAMGTIGLSSLAGLPVSTTHILASGVAGTMVSNKTGLQMPTVKKIAMAWVFTLPASMFLAGVLFLLFRLFT